MKTLLRIIVLALILGAGAYFGLRQAPGNTQGLTLNGNVDIRSVDVSGRVAGRLQTLEVDEGAMVKAGTRLGQLDPKPYEIALRQAQGDVAVAQEAITTAEGNENAARASLQLLRAGYRPEEIEKARAELAAQEAVLVNAQQEFKRQQGLLNNRAVSQQAFDDAQKTLDTQTQVVAAHRAALSMLKAGYRQEEIERAEAQLQAATSAVAEARARHAAALVREEQAELNLADTRLTAPSDGIVTTRIAEPGSMLQVGAPVLSISLRSPIRVRAYVDEIHLDAVKLGMSVNVRTDGGTECHGTVTYISPQAEFTPKTVQTADIRTTLVYRILVTLDPGAEHLNAGAPVTVIIP